MDSSKHSTRTGPDGSPQAGRLVWTWRGETIELGLDWNGQGPTVLLLPALSSISTRREMWPLQQRLGPRFRTISVDWPGFGDRPRPRVDWSPEAYSAFLKFVLAELPSRVHAVIAAGHAATYALAHAVAAPNSFDRLVLVAPTWRGPLPTMMNGRHRAFDFLCRAVDLPVVGPVLYKLNVNRFVVGLMSAGHVYADPEWLRGERLRDKLAVTRARGARFSSIRFVTGALDLLATRQDFLALARQVMMPTLVVYGDQTPARSRAEIEELTAVPGVRSACLPRGKLSLHEEFADEAAQAIVPFLADHVQPDSRSD